MLNKVLLIGRLGQDPVIKYTKDNRAIANFSIATSEEWQDKKTKEKQKKTEWHRVVAFGVLAKIAGQYLTKGKLVYLEGKLQTRAWEKDGITRYTTEIVAEKIKFLESKKNEGFSVPSDNQETNIKDSDIPF